MLGKYIWQRCYTGLREVSYESLSCVGTLESFVSCTNDKVLRRLLPCASSYEERRAR
jgi:hypothetical protein